MNKVAATGKVTDPSELIAAYQGGMSLPDLAKRFGLSQSTVRYHVKKSGSLRTRGDGVRLSSWKIGDAHRGKTRVFTENHKKAIAEGRLKHGEENAAGVSLKPSGYLEYTRGVNKGRSVHVVLMEARIGRRLLPDECVHHIDGNKINNDDNNLALLTVSGHARLHRLQENMAGVTRGRNGNGRFS